MNLPNKRSFLLVLTIVGLVAASLACNLPLRGRETPTPIPVNAASVEELATQVASAASSAASGDSIALFSMSAHCVHSSLTGYHNKVYSKTLEQMPLSTLSRMEPAEIKLKMRDRKKASCCDGSAPEKTTGLC